jgi:hypothetical protein
VPTVGHRRPIASAGQPDPLVGVAGVLVSLVVRQAFGRQVLLRVAAALIYHGHRGSQKAAQSLGSIRWVTRLNGLRVSARSRWPESRAPQGDIRQTVARQPN